MSLKAVADSGQCHECGNNSHIIRERFCLYVNDESGSVYGSDFWYYCSYCGSQNVTAFVAGVRFERDDIAPQMTVEYIPESQPEPEPRTIPAQSKGRKFRA